MAATVSLALMTVAAVGWYASDRFPRPDATTATARPPGAPRVLSTPVALLGDVENRRRQQFALAQLFTTPREADLRGYLLLHHFGGTPAITPVVASVSGSATGRHVFDLGHLAESSLRGTVTVLMSCDRPSSYAWTLTSPGPEHDDPTSIDTHGPECSGHVVAATVRPRIGRAPTRLEVVVPARVRILVTVVLNPVPPRP